MRYVYLASFPPTLSFSLPPCHPAPSFPLSLKSPSSPYSFLHFTAMSLLQMLAVSAPWAESQWWAPAGIQSTILAFSSKQLLLAVIKGSSFSISVWMGSLALGKTSTSAHPPILSGQEHIVSLCPDFDPIKPSHAIYRIGYKKRTINHIFSVKSSEWGSGIRKSAFLLSLESWTRSSHLHTMYNYYTQTTLFFELWPVEPCSHTPLITWYVNIAHVVLMVIKVTSTTN